MTAWQSPNFLKPAMPSKRPRPEQLYDALLDPAEKINLVDKQDFTEVLADMRGRLDRWMRETDDPLLRWSRPRAARRRRQ